MSMVQKAKYEQITEWIQEQITAGGLKPGMKMYTEYELVSIFNVSRQTVRHAIAVLERQGIVTKRRGSGTYISEQKTAEDKHSQTMRIAMIITYGDQYIFSGIIREAERVLSKAGYTLQIAFTNNAVEKERMLLKGFLEEGGIDGVIAEPAKSGLPNPNASLYHRLIKKGIPVLFLNSYYPQVDAPHVCLNDRLAGKMVTEHLLQCGHREIGAVFKSDDGQGHKRYEGYIEALMEADVKVRDERVVWIDTEELRHMSDDAGRILKRLAGCTACVCYNDEVAHKLVSICLEQGIKVPEELSVTGIDNSELARFCEIPLTSVENPVQEVGAMAAHNIMELIRGNMCGQIELEPKLIVRNSVRIIN